MTLELFGLTLHEADVALTDVGLAVLGGWFAQRLWRRREGCTLRYDGAIIMAALAAAALFGAIFHAFFPLKTTTRPGFLMWMPVAASIAVASAMMLTVSARRLLDLSDTARRLLVGAYALAFVVVVLFVNESYGTIVKFYGPALLLMLAVSVREALRGTDPAWRQLSAGLALSVLAALLQQARVILHPVYFDHNALYHVVQSAALVLIYRGIAAARRDPVSA